MTPREEFIEALQRALGSRQNAYRKTFTGPLADVVLKDLAKFCRAHETTANPDSPNVGLILEGRREVWLRIAKHLNLSPQQLWTFYSAGEFDK